MELKHLRCCTSHKERCEGEAGQPGVSVSGSAQRFLVLRLASGLSSSPLWLSFPCLCETELLGAWQHTSPRGRSCCIIPGASSVSRHSRNTMTVRLVRIQRRAPGGVRQATALACSLLTAARPRENGDRRGRDKTMR